MTAPVRTLVHVVRRVPDAEREAYRALWAPLRDAAQALGAHAWHFRGAADGTRIVEFLEWKGGDARTDAAVRAAKAAVDARFPAEQEEGWTEFP